MTFSDEIRRKLLESGASVVGFADLLDIPQYIRAGLRYGIAFGVALKPEAVLGLKNGKVMEFQSEYNRVKKLLDELDRNTEKFLIESGYDAISMTKASAEARDKTTRDNSLHNMVATRAGIGWNGKCDCLVTEEFGSAVLISSILTNAELDAGMPIETSKCGNCTLCLSISFNIESKESHAGLCMLACPWTKRYFLKDARSVCGGVELLPSVEMLWQELREHHAQVSKDFSESIRNRTFTDRICDFKEKENSHKFRVELIRIGDKKVIGYCISSFGNDLTGEIESIFIREIYRGLGIGNLLMKNSINWMDEKGARKKKIGVVAGNDSALLFYEKYGFKVRSYVLEQV